MKNLLKTTSLVVTLLFSSIALSNPTQKLGQCLIGSLSPNEKEQLATWIFLSISVHPEIERYSKADDAVMDTNNKQVGGLISRLMIEDCPAELKAAHASNPQAIEQAFSLVGEVAMQQLMTDPKVNNAISAYMQYTDLEGIGRVLQ